MRRLENKVCIITGAASGMGKAALGIFLEEGAKIMAIDIVAENLKKVVEAADSENVISYVMDIGDQEAWKAAVQKTVDKWGRIDVLVNNAGRPYHVNFEDTTVELWKDVLSSNLVGAWIGMHEVVPYMKAQGGGSIVNCGSNTALQGGDVNGIAYGAAKGGIRSLTKLCAMSLGKYGIRVNCVHPGPTLVDRVMTYVPGITVEQLGETFKDRINLPPHAGEAKDIAYAYLFLACDESKFITGIDIPVDGGWSSGYVPIQ